MTRNFFLNGERFEPAANMALAQQLADTGNINIILLSFFSLGLTDLQLVFALKSKFRFFNGLCQRAELAIIPSCANTDRWAKLFFGVMNQKDIHLADLFYNEALESQKRVIKFGDFKPKSLGYFDKLKAKRAINYFQKLLKIKPDDFRLFFFIGKNYQSLKEFEKAFYYLEKSVELNMQESILPFEASIVAIHLDLTDKAISLVKEAIKRNPDEASLLAVYAMYLLIAGCFTDAQIVINQAFKTSPRDNFIIDLKVIVDEVKLGHLTQPTLYSLFNK